MKGKVHFGAYDATANKKYGKVFEVKGFPTIKGFIDGKDFEYSGGRSAKQLASWYSEKEQVFVTPAPEKLAEPMYTGTTDVVVLTDGNFESEVMKASDPWVVEFYAPVSVTCVYINAMYIHETYVIANEYSYSIHYSGVDIAKN